VNSDGRESIEGLNSVRKMTYVPWFLSINVHGFYEYSAEDRFRGGSFGVSVAKKF
jgi:hypothetical protein